MRSTSQNYAAINSIKQTPVHPDNLPSNHERYLQMRRRAGNLIASEDKPQDNVQTFPLDDVPMKPGRGTSEQPERRESTAAESFDQMLERLR